MIMRITWGKLHPGKWGEYEQAYNATGVRAERFLQAGDPCTPPALSEISRRRTVR